MKTNYISKLFTGATFSGLLLLALFGVSASSAMAAGAKIKVQKQVCTTVGQNNTCNEKNYTLKDQTVNFTVALESDPGTIIDTIPVVIDKGSGELGFTSRDGFLDNTTYRVCEISPAGFTSLPQPDGSTGGGSQTADGNCIITTTTSGQTVVQFINVVTPAMISIIKDVSPGTSTTGFGFTTTNLSPSSFTLYDDNGVHSNTQLFSVTDFTTSKTVKESATAGFPLIDLQCSGGSTGSFTTNFANSSVTFNPVGGDNITCTFTNGTLSPTAAGANIGGRVINANGRGINLASVTVFDTYTSESKTVSTNAFGYFNLPDMPVGHLYLISVKHRLYSFTENTQNFNLTEDLTSIQFVGQPTHFSPFIIAPLNNGRGRGLN